MLDVHLAARRHGVSLGVYTLMPRVVAVFGGGGAKSVAHVGAAKALAEAGLTPSHYVGTSFGAVVAAALASGSAIEEITDQLLHPAAPSIVALDWVSFLKGFFADHLLKSGPLEALIARLVPARRFEDLKVPLFVTATDLDSGDLTVFGGPGGRSMDLHRALYASCALPLYYSPAAIDGRRFGDGGVRAVLPLGPAQDIPADLVVAVHVGPGFDEGPSPDTANKLLPPPLVRAHGTSERIMMAAQTEAAIAAWPRNAARLIVVRPVAEREATFAVHRLAGYLDSGYRKTKEALASL